MVRCMLKSKGLPYYLWGEVASTTMYVLNKSPTKRLEGKTPEEAWTGLKSSVSHFRIFGSICFKHVPDQLRKKLDDKGEHMKLIGYHPTGGYKLYDPRNKQVIVSRDVVIDETRGCDWKLEAGSGSTRMIVDTSNPIESEMNTSAPTELRRSTRVRQLPPNLNVYDIVPDSLVDSEGELVHYPLMAKAKIIEFEKPVQEPKWINAMKDEIGSIERNQTWELVSLPHDKKPIALKWVYKVKVNPNGEGIKHKARLVAKGFLQKVGIDYGEIYALVARMEIVRLVVAIANLRGQSMHQLDMKSTNLNGSLDGSICESTTRICDSKAQGEGVQNEKGLVWP